MSWTRHWCTVLNTYHHMPVDITALRTGTFPFLAQLWEIVGMGQTQHFHLAANFFSRVVTPNCYHFKWKSMSWRKFWYIIYVVYGGVRMWNRTISGGNICFFGSRLPLPSLEQWGETRFRGWCRYGVAMQRRWQSHQRVEGGGSLRPENGRI